MAHIVIEIKGSTVHLDRNEAERILSELRAILEPGPAVASSWTSTFPGGGWTAQTGTSKSVPLATTGTAPVLPRDQYPTICAPIFEGEK